MVTRQSRQSDTDVLLFATQNSTGHAHIVAVEAPGMTAGHKAPRLMWCVDVSGPKRPEVTDQRWLVSGQLANSYILGTQDKKFGVVVSVIEASEEFTQLYVKLIA